jgi:hypothetical protein
MTTALIIVGALLVVAVGAYAIHRIRVKRMWDTVDRTINGSSILPPQ